MAFVYLLITQEKSKFISYVGWSNDLKKRLKQHNKGTGAKFTRGRKWKLIYYEIFSNKKEAMKREYNLKKNFKLRNYIKKLYLEKKI
mgnify:CR=1 FL=1